MKRATFLIAVLIVIGLSSCQEEPVTGIEYRNMLDGPVKVTIYLAEDENILNLEMHQINSDDLTFLETFSAEPLSTTLIHLPAGLIKTEYTPEGCWRVLPAIIELEEGEIHQDSLWFALPLWN